MSIKGHGHSLTFAKCHRVFKLKSFFSFLETVELFETKYGSVAKTSNTVNIRTPKIPKIISKCSLKSRTVANFQTSNF